MTNTSWSEIKDALRVRLSVVADRALYERDPAAHLDRLRTASETLDRLVAALPPGTDPALRHYLERQSYLKALDWLEAHSA